MRWFDALLGIHWHPMDVELNWRGRAFERVNRTKRRMSRALDTALGIHWGPSDEVLNWRGRMAERGLRTWHRVQRRADAFVGLSWSPAFIQLSWKGKLIERARRVWRTLLGTAFVTARAIVNETAFAAYRVWVRVRRRKRVKAVLQLSIVSSKPWMISRTLRRQGLKSEYFALNTDIGSGILNIGSDYALLHGTPPVKRRLLEVFYLWTVLARYDVIHSHFNTLLSEDGWEFKYLKRLGKAVVFTFRGCDLRSRTLNMKLHSELNCCTECDYPVGSCDTDYQRFRLSQARSYGDAFFVTTPDLVDFFPGSLHMPFIQPVVEGLDEIAPASRTDGVFRVVTSSNHHGIDGTRFIIAAVDRLRTEGHAIELIVVSNQKYRDALAIYKSADVYVGKLRLGYYNNANIETMMLGVPNMSFVRPEYQRIVPDCPIIVTTPDTVYDQLLYYIVHRDELRAIGARGPEFVKRHHEADMLAGRLIEQYNRLFARLQTPAA